MCIFLCFLKTIYLYLDFIFSVLKFLIPLLGIIFVILLTNSIQSISADHTEPGIGIFKDATNVNIVDSERSSIPLENVEGSKYKIFMHAVIRNVDGHLITTIENTANGAYIPHKITDHVFDTLMGKKEIVTIDNIKYEKVQYMFTPTLVQRTIGYYPIFSELTVELEMGEDVYTKMNEEKKNYSIWKIHYCAEFDGHGYRCIPIFQVLMPTLTLEPSDTPTQQWTILRELS